MKHILDILRTTRLLVLVLALTSIISHSATAQHGPSLVYYKSSSVPAEPEPALTGHQLVQWVRGLETPIGIAAIDVFPELRKTIFDEIAAAKLKWGSRASRVL
jgi:hypothetical protein